MMRWLIRLHRYLGIAIGWLIVVWCLSGVVMMYVAFPEVSADERRRALPPLELHGCCAVDASAWDTALTIGSARAEMFAGEPVLRVSDAFGRAFTLALSDGRAIDARTGEQARAAAAALQPAARSPEQLGYAGEVLRDQWTVTAQYDRHRPLHRFTLGDDAATEWYISSATGELVQATTASERFWNYVGAVPHWLYPTLLRQNGPLWLQTVIWASIVGAFLTVLGLYIGVMRLRRRPRGNWSPYRGFALWHHLLGLAFGVFTLTWLVSGLLSVNPWGALEGGGAQTERERLRGVELTLGDALNWVEGLAGRPLPPGTVQIELGAFGGERHAIARGRDGRAQRLDAETLEPAPLDEAKLTRAARRLAPDGVAAASVLTRGDAFYFEHHRPRPFPVYRVVADDDEATRYYIDAATGALVQKTDSARRWYRWLFEGLHRIDFTAGLRERPYWDLLVLVLLAGATGVSATGTYLGLRSLTR